MSHITDRSEDPTQDRTIGHEPNDDPTQGNRSRERSGRGPDAGAVDAAQALASIDEAVQTAVAARRDARVDALLLAGRASQPDESGIHRLARHVTRSAVEQRQNRTLETEVPT